MTYYHPYNLLRGLRSSVPASQLQTAYIQDWLGSAVFVLGRLLQYNSQWMVIGDFITQYAGKCAGRKLSPWSTDASHHLNPFVPAKKFKLFIVTERPYTPEECMHITRRTLFHSHPGLQRITDGDTEYSVRVYFDNGLGEMYVTIRFIAMTTPVFDVDILGLTSTGFDIYRYAEHIPILIGQNISQQMSLMYKPLIIERLIENICGNTANIIAVPQLGEENARQRRYISRQLLKVVSTEKHLLNSPCWIAEFTKDDTCAICCDYFSDDNPAKRMCEQCGYLVHNRCVFDYIQSRLETYTYITCLTCRKQLPLWRGIIMNHGDVTWEGCYTDSTVTCSESSGEIFLDSEDEIASDSVFLDGDTDSIPDLESDHD